MTKNVRRRLIGDERRALSTGYLGPAFSVAATHFLRTERPIASPLKRLQDILSGGSWIAEKLDIRIMGGGGVEETSCIVEEQGENGKRFL